MATESDPISDDEFVYRRIPISMSWYDREKDLPPSPQAFRPHKERDKTGLSFYRANFVDPQTLAQNDRGRQFYIAAFLVEDLRRAGLHIEPRPLPGDIPGHCEITDIRSDNREDMYVEEILVKLATELCIRPLDGPFP